MYVSYMLRYIEKCRVAVWKFRSVYLDNILNNYYVFFDNMVSQIYPSELQLNKTNTSDTEAAFLDFVNF